MGHLHGGGQIDSPYDFSNYFVQGFVAGCERPRQERVRPSPVQRRVQRRKASSPESAGMVSWRTGMAARRLQAGR